MTQVTIQRITDTTFRATVDGPPTTTHEVIIDPAYHEKLTGGDCSPETLLKESFEFLLEREPNTAILRSFKLQVIGHYFPEYEREIGGRLR
jgi:hypothetical protein